MSTTGSTSSRLLFRPPRAGWMPSSQSPAELVTVPEAPLPSTQEPPMTSPVALFQAAVIRAAELLEQYRNVYPHEDYIERVLLPVDRQYLYTVDVQSLESLSFDRVMGSVAARLFREAVYEFYHCMMQSVPAVGYADVVRDLVSRRPEAMGGYVNWAAEWMQQYEEQMRYRSQLYIRLSRARAESIHSLLDYAQTRWKLGVEEAGDQLVQCLMWRLRHQQDLQRFREFLVRMRTLISLLVVLWEKDYLEAMRRLDEAFARILHDTVFRPLANSIHRAISQVIDRVGDEVLGLTDADVVRGCFSADDLGLTDIVEFALGGVEDYVKQALRLEAYFQVEQGRRNQQARQGVERARKLESARRLLTVLDLMLEAIERVTSATGVLDFQLSLSMISDTYRRMLSEGKEARG